MAVTANPNIIMGFRAPEIQNPMALAAQGAQLQQAQTQNKLAQAQIDAMPAKAQQAFNDRALKVGKDVLARTGSASEFNQTLDSVMGGDASAFHIPDDETFQMAQNKYFPQKQAGGMRPTYKPVVGDDGKSRWGKFTEEGIELTDMQAPNYAPSGQIVQGTSDSFVVDTRPGGAAPKPLGLGIKPSTTDGDYTITYDENGRVTSKRAIPGTKAYQAEMADFTKDAGVAGNISQQSTKVKRLGKELLESKDLGYAFGAGSVVPAVPGFAPANIRSKVEGFKRLLQTTGMQNLKANAGSAGGAMSVAEWPKMEALFGNLESTQDEETAKGIIKEILDTADEMERNAQVKLKNQWGGTDYIKNYGGGAGNTDPLEGKTATSANGQKVIRRNGKWEPM